MSVQTEGDYEDLLGLWSDLEAGLGVLLGSPLSIREFQPRVRQYDRWMQDLLRRDTDVGLYLLFQLASSSSVGYSASHALVCAVLCHLIGTELGIAPEEREGLVFAALTMNIAMTQLQDELAQQLERPNGVQMEAIRSHASRGQAMLAKLGVTDPIWLGTIELHHDDSTGQGDFRTLPPARRLARVLRMVDRYAAMISPRKSREGRSVTDSLRSIIGNAESQGDEAGHTLVRAVGLCPPGTIVRLDNGQVAVVIRRSQQLNRPFVAIVQDEAGALLKPPRLHRTAHGNPGIKAALNASVVQDRLNHHLILQLGAYAGQQG
jgi:HD-GYP domain-containing protein (c-di-GMP phosphodiesterase class II)